MWDARVKDISGGLTIYPPVHGVWISDAGDEYKERMIPVRIMATRAQMVDICAMTKTYYEQLAVLAYRISDDVIYDGES